MGRGLSPTKKGVHDPDFFLEEEKWKANSTADFNAEIFIYLLGNDAYVMMSHGMVNDTPLGSNTFVSFVLFLERNMPHKILGQRTQHLLLSSRSTNNDSRTPHFIKVKVEKHFNFYELPAQPDLQRIFVSFQLNRNDLCELPAQPERSL